MTEQLHRIRRVRPDDGPASLVVDWDDGTSLPVDFTGVIARVKAFAPLNDPELFGQANVIDFGTAIGWPNGLDYSAESLRLIAEEQQAMTQREFVSWQESLVLSNQEAAELLGFSLGTIKNYRGGGAIPKAVRMTCRATLRNPTVFRAHYRPRKVGRPRKSAQASRSMKGIRA